MDTTKYRYQKTVSYQSVQPIHKMATTEKPSVVEENKPSIEASRMLFMQMVL